MEILFCSDALNKNLIDEDYHEELKVVDSLGIIYSMFDFDMLVDEGNIKKAIKYIPESPVERIGIYRGWMLGPKYYELYDALLNKNLRLINNPHDYFACHYLPNSLEIHKGYTPHTIFTNGPEIPDLAEFLKPFGSKAIIIKDYVKSEKHFWNTACFCPDASDIKKVEDTIKNFRELRDVIGGLVFREYIELDKSKYDDVLCMPISTEFRLFFLYNKLINISKYWQNMDADCGNIPVEIFEELAKNISSNFFTMDIAKTKEGKWIVIEVGDGQVSGLPRDCNIEKFYKEILNAG